MSYEQSRSIVKMARKTLGLVPPKRGAMIPKALSESQVAKLLAVISDPKDLILFRLIYSCALRVSGLCNLKRSDVDLDNCTITIHWSKSNGGVIPFARSLQPLLRMHMASTEANEYLFQSGHKTAGGGPKPYSTRAIQLRFKHYAQIAGLSPDVAVHALRHSCLSHLAAKGLTSSQLQGVSLHRSKQSLDSYVRLSAVEIRDAYDEVMK